MYTIGAVGRAISVQSVACTSSSTGAASTFSAQTRVIKISSDTDCHYLIGNGAQTAAASTSPYLPQRWVEYVKVNPGESIAFIRAATGGANTATDGVAWVTEITA